MELAARARRPRGASVRAAAARRRACWDAGAPASALEAVDRDADLLRARRATSSSSSRPTPGWRSTCSSRATATPSTRRWRRSRPAPSGCASRCSPGTRPCGGRCARCWRGSSISAEELAADALAPGSGPRRSPRPSTTRSSCSAIRREQARMDELECRPASSVAATPHRPGWRAALAMLLCETDRHEEAQRRARRARRAAGSPTSRPTATG